MRAGQGHGHQQVVALIGHRQNRPIRNVVRVSLVTARWLYGNDGALVAHAAARIGDALAIMRVDRERGDRDRIGLHRIVNDVALGDHVHALHAAAFADVEIRRKVVGISKLVRAQPPLGDAVALRFGEHRVGGEEVDKLERVLLVCLEDRGPARLIGRGPAFGAADEADGELLIDCVVPVLLAVRDIIAGITDRTASALDIAPHHLETGGIIVVRRGHRNLVAGIGRQRQAEAVSHDIVVTGIDRPCIGRGGEGQRNTIGIKPVDVHQRLRVLLAGIGLAEVRRAFAVDRPAHSGGCHQVALVAAVDKGVRNERVVAGGHQAFDVFAIHVDRIEPLSCENINAGLGQHLRGDAHSHVGFVGPAGRVLHVDIVG